MGKGEMKAYPDVSEMYAVTSRAVYIRGLGDYRRNP